MNIIRPTGISSAISAYLRFRGANTSTVFYDDSTYHSAFTPTSAVISTTQRKFGGSSGYFNGSSILAGPNSDALFNLASTKFGVGFWMYPVSVSGPIVLLDRRDSVSTGYGWNIVISGTGTIAIQAVSFLQTGAIITANTWTYVLVLFDGTNTKIYYGTIPGAALTLGTSGGAIVTQTYSTPLLIGKANNGAANYYNGYFAEVIIYKGVIPPLTVPTRQLI